ncbi:MAG: hypothetical protein P8J79_06100 [Halioglobus sp.]|nr:hypothetical protein [Halioglobus sp.]
MTSLMKATFIINGLVTKALLQLTSVSTEGVGTQRDGEWLRRKNACNGNM